LTIPTLSKNRPDDENSHEQEHQLRQAETCDVAHCALRVLPVTKSPDRFHRSFRCRFQRHTVIG